MDRRSVLKGLGITTGLALAGNSLGVETWAQRTVSQSASSAIAPHDASTIRLVETPTATLHISERTGDLVGLHWKDPGLDLIQEPRLGENFRLLLPKPGYEAAYFNSREQTASHIEETSDGVLCTYESLRREGSREN